MQWYRCFIFVHTQLRCWVRLPIEYRNKEFQRDTLHWSSNNGSKTKINKKKTESVIDKDKSPYEKYWERQWHDEKARWPNVQLAKRHTDRWPRTRCKHRRKIRGWTMVLVEIRLSTNPIETLISTAYSAVAVPWNPTRRTCTSLDSTVSCSSPEGKNREVHWMPEQTVLKRYS